MKKIEDREKIHLTRLVKQDVIQSPVAKVMEFGKVFVVVGTQESFLDLRVVPGPS
jgi:hypothetical protein